MHPDVLASGSQCRLQFRRETFFLVQTIAGIKAVAKSDDQDFRLFRLGHLIAVRFRRGRCYVLGDSLRLFRRGATGDQKLKKCQ